MRGNSAFFKGLNSGCISRRRPRFAFIASPIHYCSGRAIKARHNGTENTRGFPPLFWGEKILFFLFLMQIFLAILCFWFLGKPLNFLWHICFPCSIFGSNGPRDKKSIDREGRGWVEAKKMFTFFGCPTYQTFLSRAVFFSPCGKAWWDEDASFNFPRFVSGRKSDPTRFLPCIFKGDGVCIQKNLY